MKSTKFLFAQPKLSKRLARTLDCGSTLTPYDFSTHADDRAVRSDWNMVATDMKKAIVEYDKKQRPVNQGISEK